MVDSEPKKHETATRYDYRKRGDRDLHVSTDGEGELGEWWLGVRLVGRLAMHWRGPRLFTGGALGVVVL